MNNLLTTIRAKMLLSYGVYIVILIVIIGTGFWFENRLGKIEQLSETLGKAKDDLQAADEALAAFFNDEIRNIEFHKTQQSKHLQLWRNKTTDALAQFEKLDSIKTDLGLKTPLPIGAVKRNIDSYEKGFEELIGMVIFRGFEDYGLEGEMRTYIHSIEEIPLTNQALMLMCRRHEKDFFLRKQTKYINRLKDATEALKIDLIQKTQPGIYQDSLVEIINNYRNIFVEIVQSEEYIGFDNQSGLRGKINEANNQLSQQLQQYSDFTQKTIANLKFSSQNIQVSIISGGLILGIFLAFFMPQILSKPVRKLSSSIHSVIGNNFEPGVEVAKVDTRDEIGQLSNDFAFMLSKMQGLLEELKANNERTEKEQQLLLDSIRYARQIQGAILPDKELINNFFPDYFLIYRPLHMVSGDFFWMIRKKDKIYVAVADCTGHGVPGAFMSMIGHTLLNKILNQDHIYEPAAILEILHLEVREALHQDKTGNAGDGMDIGLFSMEYFENKPEERLITYAGAKIPFIYTENGKTKTLKPTRRSIGGGFTRHENKSFVSHILTLRRGDYIYMATDGFADQNDINREKFGKKNLIKTIARNSMISLELQKQQLETALEQHQEGTLQRDDITVLALQL